MAELPLTVTAQPRHIDEVVARLNVIIDESPRGARRLAWPTDVRLNIQTISE